MRDVQDVVSHLVRLVAALFSEFRIASETVGRFGFNAYIVDMKRVCEEKFLHLLRLESSDSVQDFSYLELWRLDALVQEVDTMLFHLRLKQVKYFLSSECERTLLSRFFPGESTDSAMVSRLRRSYSLSIRSVQIGNLNPHNVDSVLAQLREGLLQIIDHGEALLEERAKNSLKETLSRAESRSRLSVMRGGKSLEKRQSDRNRRNTMRGPVRQDDSKRRSKKVQ